MDRGLSTQRLERISATSATKSGEKLNSHSQLTTQVPEPLLLEVGDEDEDARMQDLLKQGIDPTAPVESKTREPKKAKALSKAKPLVASPHAVWLGKEYNRRSVAKTLRGKGEGFCGHERILDLILRAKQIGDTRPHADGQPTGDMDAGLVSFYFLSGARSREAIYSGYRPQGDRKEQSVFKNAEGDDIYYGVRKADLEYKKDKGAYICTLRVLKKRIRKLVGVDPVSGKKIYETERDVNQVRVFPILETERELPYLLNWTDKLKPNDWLFPVSYAKVYRLVNEISGGEFWPHRLRFERASSLVRDYGYDSLKLVSFFRWQNVKEAALYAGQNVDDLITAMRSPA